MVEENKINNVLSHQWYLWLAILRTGPVIETDNLHDLPPVLHANALAGFLSRKIIPSPCKVFTIHHRSPVNSPSRTQIQRRGRFINLRILSAQLLNQHWIRKRWTRRVTLGKWPLIPSQNLIVIFGKRRSWGVLCQYAVRHITAQNKYSRNWQWLHQRCPIVFRVTQRSEKRPPMFRKKKVAATKQI